MEKILISINGINGAGKTTLIKNIVSQNNLFGYVELKGTNKLRDYNWWFYKSTPEELIDELYQCLYKRRLEIENINKRIIFVDKGFDTIMARLFATLSVRGCFSENIDNYLKKFSLKCQDLKKEDIKILLEDEYIPFENSFFSKYNKIQFDYLKEIQFDLHYKSNQNSKEEIYKKIFDFWENRLKKTIENLDITIYGISGLSESGKSSMGQYLNSKYGIWNLKLKYFASNLKDKGIIEKKNFFFSLAFIEEIVGFVQAHYYKNAISIESLWNTELIDQIKYLFANKFKIVYILAEEKIRIDRNTGDNKELIAKDNFKKSKKVDELQKKCDVIVHNNGSFRNFYRQIDYMVNMNSYRNPTTVKPVSELNIHESLKTIIINIQESLFNKFKNEIMLFSVVGSCALEVPILGWSDIDIMIITKDSIKEIMKFLNLEVQKYNIHIGVNCFSMEQITSMDIDMKTKWYIYFMQNNVIYPSYISENINLPCVIIEHIIKSEEYIINEIIFSINRELYSPNTNGKKLLKKLLVFIKIEALRYGLICKSMQETLCVLNDIWNIDYKKYLNISESKYVNTDKVKLMAEEVMKNVYECK